MKEKLERIPLQQTVLTPVRDQLTVAGKPLTEFAQRRLSSMVGIPARFLEQCSLDLSIQILSEFIGKSKRQLDAVALEGNITSFAWTDALIFPIRSVVETIEAAVDYPIEISKVSRTENEFSIFLTDPEAFQVINRDSVHFGVAFRSSFDGSSAVKVIMSMFRPICTNGAYITEQSYTLPRRVFKQVVS